MTLSDNLGAYPNFKGMPLFDDEYLRNGTIQRQSYTRPTQRCNFAWYWVLKQNFQQRGASRGLSATAELFVGTEFNTGSVRARQSNKTGVAFWPLTWFWAPPVRLIKFLVNINNLQKVILCLRQARLAGGGIMFWTWQFVCPSIRSSVRSYLAKLVNMICWKQVNRLWCKLAQVVHGTRA